MTSMPGVKTWRLKRKQKDRLNHVTDNWERSFNPTVIEYDQACPSRLLGHIALALIIFNGVVWY